MESLPEVLQPGAIKDPEKIKFMEETFVCPVRIWLPDNTYKWNDRETLFYNLCGLHGFNQEKESPVKILIANARDRSVHELKPEETKQISGVLNQCIIDPQLNSPHKKHLWCSDSPVYFIIEGNNEGEGFALGYLEERFIMKNNFYTLIFPEDKAEELTERMHQYIQKYIEPEEI